jgi:hypothetical protein
MAISTALAAALAGGLLSGVGAGVGGAMSASADKDAAKQQALGPIRGGTERAGNKEGMPSMQALERIGKASIPIKSPVYGDPINPNDLFAQKSFGTGFTPGGNRSAPARRFV